ncbi:hypothetical protein FB382_002460 [Nocardioides ginsengisegetis]|uniref:Uncharacterized protein n=1 Tax=Nocardioides ginsengisegetis TaxID=661491 RepID=A0A7W3J0Y7_9ACTN|nr:hypothetical protein [Nocardioides ginsengisegetis]
MFGADTGDDTSNDVDIHHYHPSGRS